MTAGRFDQWQGEIKKFLSEEIQEIGQAGFFVPGFPGFASGVFFVGAFLILGEYVLGF